MAEIPNPFDIPAVKRTEQQELFRLNAMTKNKPMGTQFYLKVKGQDVPVANTNVMKFGQYANPELALHSTYFKSLDAMMKCVEKNAGVTDPVEQGKVC